jgi:hypothetical protein
VILPPHARQESESPRVLLGCGANISETAMTVEIIKRTPWFAECQMCGERWKVATLPMDLKDAGLLKHLRCPNCGERKKLFMCYSSGPKAVKKARKGKPQ